MTNIGHSPVLYTDLYQLTMAQAYWQHGTTAPATFSLFIRSYSSDRGYLVLAGIQNVIEYLDGFRYTKDDIDYLLSTGKFDAHFLGFLTDVRFTGDVRAMPEGSIFFANEPVLEVTAPIIEAQVVETYIINQINLQTILATKAARVVHAANGGTVVDFAARRTQGTDAGLKLARACYMVGYAGTSNVLAGRSYGIPTVGTMAHSYVQASKTEQRAFESYAESFPDATTLLVDTYDSVGGVERAIAVAQKMKREGHRLRAIRLDSGDLLDLSIKARRMLGDAGLPDVQVFVSGGLDEFEIDRLLMAGAPIDGFGVGTVAGVSADAPWTDCAYKLVEYDGAPTMKLSSNKQSLPGPKQVYWFRGEDGERDHDVIATASQPSPPGGDATLIEVMNSGRLVGELPSLEDARTRFSRNFDNLPVEYKALRSPPRYPVRVSRELERLAETVEAEIRQIHGLT